MKLRKTLFLSEKELSQKDGYRYQAPYIFYSRGRRKWYEDIWYFDDPDEVTQTAQAQGYHVV